MHIPVWAVILNGFRRRPDAASGGRCTHRNHLLKLRCRRESTYQYQCAKHNDSCFHAH
jgi:hypothetical protein